MKRMTNEEKRDQIHSKITSGDMTADLTDLRRQWTKL